MNEMEIFSLLHTLYLPLSLSAFQCKTDLPFQLKKMLKYSSGNPRDNELSMQSGRAKIQLEESQFQMSRHTTGQW